MTSTTHSSATILVLDQGTTGSTAALFAANTLELLATTKQEFSQHYPKPGWVEHHPGEIWESVVTAIAGTLKKASSPANSIAAIGVTNQRETVVPFHRETGAPLRNAIVWQDRRTAERCTQISADAITER